MALKKFGPGALVTAAFVGPGTVTTCTLAGAGFGYSLAWALVFATLATVVLQEMVVRLATVTGLGLGEALNAQVQGAWKWALYVLVLLAICVGNAAYQGGNLSGAALGVSALWGGDIQKSAVALIAVSAGLLLYFGRYKLLEKVLLGLVLLMALAFVATFISVGADVFALGKAMLIPRMPEGALVTAVALIGTTVVPYNLFLHAAAVKTTFSGSGELAAARWDTALTIGMGGLIALLILSTAAATLFAHGLAVTNGADMAQQLQPLFGAKARWLMGFGLFAAGLSSAITAPLATAFAACELLQLKDEGRRYFRLVALVVVVIGGALALSGYRPLQLIVSAQFANGLLLPIIAGFLLYVMNSKTLLGRDSNGWLANSLGIAVLLVVCGLGLRAILRAVL